MTNFDFIIKYKNMAKISDVCELNGIQYPNLIQGKTTDENVSKVANILRAEIIDMYAEVMKENVNKTNSL